MFSAGWWVVIDACVLYSEPLFAAYFVCSIVSTIGLLMINAISNARVTGDNYSEGVFGQRGARAWLFFGFLFSFAGLIGSLWILIQVFIVPAIIHPQGVTLPPTQSSNETLINATTTVLPGNATNVTPTVGPTQPPEVPVYQGVAFFVQNILIFFSAMVFKFFRRENSDDW